MRSGHLDQAIRLRDEFTRLKAKIGVPISEIIIRRDRHHDERLGKEMVAKIEPMIRKYQEARLAEIKRLAAQISLHLEES